MPTLRLSNIPAVVIAQLTHIAAAERSSVRAVAIRGLDVWYRRADNARLRGALPDTGAAMSESVHAGGERSGA